MRIHVIKAVDEQNGLSADLYSVGFQSSALSHRGLAVISRETMTVLMKLLDSNGEFWFLFEKTNLGLDHLVVATAWSSYWSSLF